MPLGMTRQRVRNVGSLRQAMLLLCLVVCGLSADATTDACDSLLSAGDSLFGTFDNVRALAAYRSAYKQCPQEYEPLMKLARALNDVGEDLGDNASYRKAMAFADTLQRRFPDSLQGYFLKAAAAGNLAENSGALERVKLSRTVVRNSATALQHDSSYAPAYVILGAYYTRVAGANPILKGIANTILGGVPEGTYEDALRELKRAVELDASNMHAHLELAKAYRAVGRIDAARSHLQKVRSLPVMDHQHPNLKQRARDLLDDL